MTAVGIDHPAQLRRAGDELEVNLWYPLTMPGRLRHVVVDLVDVRVAHPLRVTFDYDRNGWSVCRKKVRTAKQEEEEEWTGEVWEERAFLPAEDGGP